MLDVCICTHNPKPELFKLILTAITNQTLAKDAYQLWVVDNASEPAICEDDLNPLAIAGVKYHLLQEPRLGTMYARELISQKVPGDALVLVDDDNELLPNYLEVATEILANHPEIGYFGGKLLSGIKIEYPVWMNQLLPYLGIKDEGDEPISKCIEGDYFWGKWEPPCAGAVIRKVVLAKYFEEIKKLPPNLILGRQGKKGLLSMADSWLANCTYQLGLECAYQPRLQLIHHIDSDRLKLEYFLRLLYNYGRSQVILKKILNQPIQLTSADSIAQKVQWWKYGGLSIEYFICLMAWEAGFAEEISQEQPTDFFSIIDAALLPEKPPIHEQQVASLEQQVASLEQQVASLEQQVASLENTKLRRLENKIIVAKSKLGWLSWIYGGKWG